MTKGFIDSASVHGALAALSLGKKAAWPLWDRQSLLETTYVLLQSETNIVPGPGTYGGASGQFRHVVTGLPGLESKKYQREAAEKLTRIWLGRHRPVLARAWAHGTSHPSFSHWASSSRRLFWFHHVRMHGALFNREFIPPMSQILECSPSDLQRVHELSTNPSTMRTWATSDRLTEDMKLAEQGWLLASLIRGKYHEFLAQNVGIHLLSHPFRQGIECELRVGETQPILNSEEYFVKTIIGTALLESTADRRVRTWVDAIAKARRAISTGQIALPDATDQADAERHAATAAQIVGLPGTSALVRRSLDVTAAVGLGVLLAIVIKPWGGVLGPASLQLYRYVRGVSVGDDLARAILSTKRRFRTLARSVPGRIERRIV